MKERVFTSLPQPLISALTRIASERRVARSALIRHILEMWVQRHDDDSLRLGTPRRVREES